MNRVTFALLSSIALLVACSPAAQPKIEPPATAEIAPTPRAVESPAASPSAAPRVDAAAQGRPGGIERLGLLTDPLPTPLSFATKATDMPRTLAKAVMAGDGSALPALLAAFAESGIAVVGPSDELVVRPAEPWQGLIVESWEVRTLLATVLPERRVTMSLTQFADELRLVPELNSPTIERLLVDDIRRLAGGTPSPKQFWARFLIELGRDPASTDELDLVTASDVSSIRLNGLQASLILRRLGLDLQMLGGTGRRSGIPHVAMSITGSPQADELPCTMTSTQKTILDIASFAAKAYISGLKVFDLGFEGLIGYLEKLGLENSGTSAVGKFKDGKSVASALLTYAKLIAIYAALEVKVEMESAPLTRTKERRPASGEAKELTALVRLNIGNAQIVNCFRIMLNAVGLDFKLTQDGPVKGARVGWQGDSGFSELVESRGGPDQIVRFVGSGSDGEFKSTNSITNAATDADGKTRVKVEGVGQRVKKSANAVRVSRRASVHVNVALKGADIFGDLADAVGNAAGGVKALVSLPADMLYRTQWASAGHHTFEVIDWSGTQWSGTLSMTKTDVTKRVEGGKTTDVTVVDEVNVNVTEATRYELVGDESSAEMKGTIARKYSKTATVKVNWSQQSDSRICVGQVFSGTDFQQESEEGSGSADAKISVYANGVDYAIFAGAVDDAEQMTIKGETLIQTHRFRQAGNGCQNVVVDTLTESLPTPEYTQGIGGIEVKGHMDPEDPTHLTGSTTTVNERNGTKTTIKITWDLRQD